MSNGRSGKKHRGNDRSPVRHQAKTLAFSGRNRGAGKQKAARRQTCETRRFLVSLVSDFGAGEALDIERVALF